jgi:hypothetical protein
MRDHLAYLKIVVAKPLKDLLADISEVLKTGIGKTSLFPTLSNVVFIDDIIEEKLLVTSAGSSSAQRVASPSSVYVVYRIFISSLDSTEKSQ